ncbi:MAG TPA: DUF2298 domain-containing protein, partial [Anaerolineales bacterium]|nr:DUF2298 domain-containing protein [Anaerolineales bacterium]
MLSAVLWYLLVAGFGWLSFPIAYRFLTALPDRGYAFARALGLLLWGFIFWILSSYGLLQNNPGGLVTAALLLAALSWWAWRQLPAGELRVWLRAQRSLVVAMELVFLLAFVFMAFVRVSRPEIFHTEQPMELAFINAILRSPSMPPHDPWLAGFSISYYYFGYLLVAMLAKLVGVTGSIAFNLGFITIFASAALGVYGLAYDLLSLYKPKVQRGLLWLACLAPLFVLVLGNVEGLLEIAHARKTFWSTDATGAQTSGFWAWLDVEELTNPPNAEPSWTPRNYGTGFWWWWRASRVINDRTLSGADQELIDEFPTFSFTLGDLHPHVLSMPFIMLAVGLALNVYLGGAERREPLRLGRMGLVAVLFVVFFLIARVVATNQLALRYFFPVAGFGLLVAFLLPTRSAIISSFLLSTFVAFGNPNALDLMLYHFIGSTIGILIFANKRCTPALLWIGVAVFSTNLVVLVASRLLLPSFASLDLFVLVAVATLNALAVVACPFLLQPFQPTNGLKIPADFLLLSAVVL